MSDVEDGQGLRGIIERIHSLDEVEAWEENDRRDKASTEATE